MWANAQRDGRPAEHRWRPLSNAAKFGWRPLLECRAVTLPRRETRWNLLGEPQTPERISAVSGPTFTILWRRGEIFLFMVALCNRADHYIFILFLLSSFFLWSPYGQTIIFLPCDFYLLSSSLWSPYVIGETIIFLPCDFYLSFFFFLA